MLEVETRIWSAILSRGSGRMDSFVRRLVYTLVASCMRPQQDAGVWQQQFGLWAATSVGFIATAIVGLIATRAACRSCLVTAHAVVVWLQAHALFMLSYPLSSHAF